MTDPVATVVIPANNEERGIGRLLDALTDEAPGAGRLRVVVVANGCTDGTADVVRAHGGAELIELSEGSKQKAMRAGAATTTAFPILYVDADVVLSAASARALVETLATPGVEAAAPARVLEVDRSSKVVASYFTLWSALPQVRAGLFGRGVIALTEAGQRRVANLPMYLSDDLALSESFAPAERRIDDDAEVIVIAPRRLADLLRRRQRIVMGTKEFDQTAPGRERTSVASLLALVRSEPQLAHHLPAFLGVTVAARLALRATRRRKGTTPWLRDESSRAD